MSGGCQFYGQNFEAIDYLIAGLQELRDMEPGQELVTPAFLCDEDGRPESAADTCLVRLA